MNRLNIAIIDMDNLRNPFWGAGQARATFEVGRILAKKHQVTVYCSKYPGYKNYVQDGIKYEHVGVVSKNPRLTNLLFVFNIPFLVQKIQSDIIIENFNAPFSVSFAPLFTKVPVIALPTMFNAKEFYKKYRIPFHWVEAIGLKFYKYILPYSDIDSSKAKKLNPKIKFKIVPQGVSKEFLQIKHETPEHILFLGRFDIWQKGIDLLLKSYSRVSDKIEYPLVLAGHGSDEGKIKDLIKKLKLENKVAIVGSAYAEKKNKLIKKAIFTAFPSRHDELSLWSLESLASGLPLVAFDLPEARWAPETVALKAKPFDLEEYSKLLLKASENNLNQKMRNASRTFAKNFTWEKVAEDFELFFIDILKERKK